MLRHAPYLGIHVRHLGKSKLRVELRHHTIECAHKDFARGYQVKCCATEPVVLVTQALQARQNQLQACRRARILLDGMIVQEIALTAKVSSLRYC